MSYASLFRTLPDFRSTNGLAALASLGIHGLALIVLPFLPFDSQSTALEQQRTVGIVELTPEEQSRLPQASTVPPSLPSFATQQSALPPLPPPPSFSVGALPPFPNPIVIPPSPLNRVPAGNTFPTAIRPNQTFLMPSLPQSNQGTTPRINQPNNQAIATGPTLNTLPPQVLTTLPPPPPLGNLQPPPAAIPNQNQTYNSGEILPPVPQWRQPTNTGLPAMRLNPASPFSPGATPTQTAQNLPAPPNNIQPQNQTPATPAPQNPQPIAAAKPQPTPDNTQKLPDRGKQELLALQQKIRQERATSRAASAPQPTATTPPSPAANPARRQQIVAALRNNSTPTQNQQPNRQQIVAALRNNNAGGSSTTPSAAAEREAQLQAWAKRQTSVQQQHTNILTKVPIYQTIKTCQRSIEGTAVLGVVVNPDGKIVSGPDFLAKKGAAGIEQAAKEYVQEYQFPKSESSVNQQFHLQYQFDSVNCSQPSEATTDTPGQQSQS